MNEDILTIEDIHFAVFNGANGISESAYKEVLEFVAYIKSQGGAAI